MITIKKNKKALFVSIIAFFSVVILGSIFLLEFNYQQGNKFINNKNILPTSIVYFYNNKGVSQIFDYSLSDKQSKLLYSDEASEYKIINITNYNMTSNTVLLSQARTGFFPERLSKIDLSTKKETIINDSINYLFLNTDSTGAQYSGILKNENQYKLITNNISTGEIINLNSLATAPENLIYLPNVNSWVYKEQSSNIKLFNSKVTDIYNSQNSIFNQYDLDSIIFNRNYQVLKFNITNGNEEELTLIDELPTTLYSYNDCLVYTFVNNDSEYNTKLKCKQTLINLDFIASKILGIKYEN